MFKCPICGKEYKTATEMGKCAISCEEKVNKAAKEAETAKREKAKATAKEAIDNCYKGLQTMIAQFNKDYPETQISISMVSETKRKATKDYKFPNEFTVPLNYNKNDFTAFDDLIDLFLK